MKCVCNSPMSTKLLVCFNLVICLSIVKRLGLEATGAVCGSAETLAKFIIKCKEKVMYLCLQHLLFLQIS